MFFYVLWSGMTLYGKFTAIKGIQEIKTDRKIKSELTGMLAHHSLVLLKHKPIKRHFQHFTRTLYD